MTVNLQLLRPKLEDVCQLANDGFNMIPVGISLSSDVLTPVLVLLRLRSQGMRCFLLESAEGGEQVGRYSYLGIEPFASFKVTGNHINIQDKRQQTNTSLIEPHPNKRLQEWISQWRSPTYPGWPPFVGGAIGYIAYDTVRFLERIPLPDTALGNADIHLCAFDKVIAFDRLKHQIFLVTHVTPLEDDVKDAYACAFEDLKNLSGLIASPIKDTALVQTVLRFGANIDLRSNFDECGEASQHLGYEGFRSAFSAVKNHIKQGDVFQCVISDRFTMDFQDDPFLIYRYLRMINPSPYLYYLDFSDEILLGSSPEMLVRIQNRQIETRPIAGTRPRGSTPSKDKKFEKELISSAKERAEHLMLVDLGRNDIGRIAKTGSVEVKRYMQIERFSHVMHLTSIVSGKLGNHISPLEAFWSCFPAGTLSGAPKIRAMEIISQQEGTRRGPYGGAVIAHDFSGNLNSCITIRSLWLKDGKAHTQAGAGIVADSRLDGEYNEILNKAKAIRMAMHLAKQTAHSKDARKDSPR